MKCVCGRLWVDEWVLVSEGGVWQAVGKGVGVLFVYMCLVAVLKL